MKEYFTKNNHKQFFFSFFFYNFIFSYCTVAKISLYKKKKKKKNGWEGKEALNKKIIFKLSKLFIFFSFYPQLGLNFSSKFYFNE